MKHLGGRKRLLASALAGTVLLCSGCKSKESAPANDKTPPRPAVGAPAGAPIQPTVIKVETFTTQQYSGNGDNVVNYSESHYLDIRLKNLTSANLDGVSAKLSTSDPCVTVNDDTPNYQLTLEPNASGWVSGGSEASADSDTYRFTVASTCPAGHVIPFNLLATDAQGRTYGDSFTITVRATGADIKYEAHAANQATGNGDADVHYGESHSLDVKLKNIGIAGTDGVLAKLSTADPYVTINSDTPHFLLTIPPNTSKWISGGAAAFADSDTYKFTMASAGPPDHPVTFKLSITDSYGNSYSDSFTITIR